MKQGLWINIGLTIASLLLWAHSLLTTVVSPYLQIDNLGLFSILPFSFYLSLSLLVISFIIAVKYQNQGRQFLFLHTFVLILVLNSTPLLVEKTARFTTGYFNYQSVDQITQNMHIDPSIQWIHNWPGFSVMYSVLVTVAQIPGQFIMGIYPTLFNVMLLFPILMLFNSVMENKKLVWVAVWAFYLINWIGQDYFSMQSLGFIAFVLSFVILLRLNNSQNGFSRRWLFLLVMFFTLSVISHALTSILLLTIIIVFFIARPVRNFPRLGLTTLFVAIFAAWNSLGARTYLEMNLGRIITQAFDIGQIFQFNVAYRLGGNPSHLLVAEIRLIFSAAVVICAVLSFLLSWRKRGLANVEKRIVLVIASVLLLSGFLSYGGELFMRLYLFSLIPLTYFLLRGLNDKRAFAVFAILFIIVVPSFYMISRYGNEVIDYVPKSEISGVQFLYQESTHGYVIGFYRDSQYHSNYTFFTFDGVPWQNNRFSFESIGSYQPDWPKFAVESYGDRTLHEFLLGNITSYNEISGNLSQSVHYGKVYSSPGLEISMENG